MRKKLFAIVLSVAILASLTLALVACDNKKDDNNNVASKNIVYLGDSIAEALIGPSPVSERDNYGYYSLIGKRSGYQYHNRSASGHKTGQLLEILNRLEPEEDEPYKDARMVIEKIRNADIINVSVLGNDLLQSDMGAIILQAATNNFTMMNGILDGTLKNSDGNVVNPGGTINNVKGIVETIRNINPTAELFFHKVYNPISFYSSLVSNRIHEGLAALGKDDSGEPKTGMDNEEDIRTLSNKVLGMLNGVLDNYLANNPGAFHILDAATEFGNIYNEDKERGKALIFPDYIHPSNEGHAVLADLTMDKMVKLGLASESQNLANYKQIRVEQLNRLYNSISNRAKTIELINAATTCQDITKLYFSAIKGSMPSYFGG